MQFFEEVAKYKPANLDMLAFVRGQPLDFFESIHFRTNDSSSSANHQEIIEDEKLPNKHKIVQEISEVSRPLNSSQISGQLVSGSPNKVKYIPTQALVISETLKQTNEEMRRLLNCLTTDMKTKEQEIKENVNMATYWNYIYNSAIYLQQMINDVTVAHNTAISNKEVRKEER